MLKHAIYLKELSDLVMIEYGKYGEKRYRLDFIDQIFNVWFCFRDFLIQDLTQITTGFLSIFRACNRLSLTWRLILVIEIRSNSWGVLLSTGLININMAGTIFRQS